MNGAPRPSQPRQSPLINGIPLTSGSGRQHRGGLPRSYLARSEPASRRWCDGFVGTLIACDLPELDSTILPATLRRLWAMVAHWHGQIWNGAEFGRAVRDPARQPVPVEHWHDVAGDPTSATPSRPPPQQRTQDHLKGASMRRLYDSTKTGADR